MMEKAATGPGDGSAAQEMLPVVFLVPKLLYPSPLEALCSGELLLSVCWVLKRDSLSLSFSLSLPWSLSPSLSPPPSLLPAYVKGRPASLLGYGDVGIPALLVTLCLKFDFQFGRRKYLRIYYATSGIGRQVEEYWSISTS